MKPTAVLLLATVVLVGATGAVAAADAGADSPSTAGPVESADRTDDQGPPPWQDDETTTANTTDDNGGETTGVSPGQQLAGAVGAQEASMQSELWNRSLSERLANATTPDERAEVLADETETIETYVETLEGVRANLTGAWDADELSEGRYRASIAEFVVRANATERRANRTARAAEQLPPGVRERNDVNVTRVRNLSVRARGLYRFEDPIAREVANETLSNQSALSGVLAESERENRTLAGT